MNKIRWKSEMGIFHKMIKKAFRRFDVIACRAPRGTITGVELLRDLSAVVETDSPICFDVGANKGQSIDLFRTSFRNPTIYAFEPSSGVYADLKKRYEASSQLHLYNMALGEEDTQRPFLNYENNELSSFLELDPCDENIFRDTAVSDMETVEMISLDSFAQIAGVKRIDVLKIDTQGYDLNVLRGAAKCLHKKMIICVLIELNFIHMYRNQGNPHEISDYLRIFDLHLVDFYQKVRLGSQPTLAWCTALYSLRKG